MPECVACCFYISHTSINPDRIEVHAGHCMNEQVQAYLNKYPAGVVELYIELRQLIYDSISCKPQETLWAKMPSYSSGEAFVRLIPFKDHINIEARSAIGHRDSLAGNKMTPKGMLQTCLNQEIPRDTLKQIFCRYAGALNGSHSPRGLNPMSILPVESGLNSRKVCPLRRIQPP